MELRVSRRVESGVILALIVAAAAGVFFIGRLEGRFSALEDTSVVTKAKEAALAAIAEAEGDALERISTERTESHSRALEDTNLVTMAKDAALGVIAEAEDAVLERISVQRTEVEAWAVTVLRSDGVILPYIGDWEDVPDGWDTCGEEGTLTLHDQLLIGTDDVENIGRFVGSHEHHHSVGLTSTAEIAGRRSSQPEAGDSRAGTNWHHQHEVIGDALPTGHIPPAVQVLFLCRVPNNNP